MHTQCPRGEGSPRDHEYRRHGHRAIKLTREPDVSYWRPGGNAGLAQGFGPGGSGDH